MSDSEMIVNPHPVVVLPIPSSEAAPWILGRHYARRMCPISFAFGAYEENLLVGVVTYGMPASPSLCRGVCGAGHSEKVLELNRLCCENRPNIASTLVGRSLQLLPKPRIVVSFADCGKGHVGYVYQATNFIYTGCSKERTDMWSPSGHARHHCGDPSKRQHRSAKHRYVFFCGDRRQVRELKAALKYAPQPYPKGESRHYDASAKVLRQLVLV